MNAPEKLTLDFSGAHHQAQVTIDSATGKLSSSAILNFANNAVAGINIDEKGKTSGVIAHSGDNHNFRIDANSNGAFMGKFELKKNGVDIGISGGMASVTKGSIPVGGLFVQGDHHSAALKVNDSGKVSGTLETRNTEFGNLKVDIAADGTIKGTYEHSGQNHATSVSFDGRNWDAKVQAGVGSSKISIGVSGGRASLAARAGVDMRF